MGQLLEEDHSLFPPIASRRYLTSEMLKYHLTPLTVFHEKGAPRRSFARSLDWESAMDLCAACSKGSTRISLT